MRIMVDGWYESPTLWSQHEPRPATNEEAGWIYDTGYQIAYEGSDGYVARALHPMPGQTCLLDLIIQFD